LNKGITFLGKIHSEAMERLVNPSFIGTTNISTTNLISLRGEEDRGESKHVMDRETNNG